jgi:tRNA A58 N-methylase Trm61
MDVGDSSGAGGSGSGGSEVSVLEQGRVGRIEIKIDRIEEALRRMEAALKELFSDNREFRRQLAEQSVKLAHLDGRISNIPTTWQTLAILATLLIGLSGIMFTTAKFLHP